MARPKRSQDHDDININLTPLIDCVFLLLVFFMVTTVFKEPFRLRVLLPEASRAGVVEEKKLVLTIDADGRMDVNGKLVTMEGLETTLEEEKERTRSLTLIIRTDKRTKHGFVLDAMEIAKRMGVKKIVLATEKKEG